MNLYVRVLHLIWLTITILKFGVTRKRQVALKWILSLKLMSFVLIFLNHDLQSLSLFLSLTVSYSFRLFLFSLLSLSLLDVTHFLSLSQLSLSLSHSMRSSQSLAHSLQSRTPLLACLDLSTTPPKISSPVLPSLAHRCM